jgi:hypothetical protein
MSLIAINTRITTNAIVRANFVTDDVFLIHPSMEYLLIRNSIRNKTTPIVFVLSPIHSSYYVSYKNKSGMHAFFNSITQIPNVHFIDMNYSYPDSMFINTTHLNYQGAIVFSKQLKDSLIKRSLL